MKNNLQNVLFKECYLITNTNLFWIGCLNHKNLLHLLKRGMVQDKTVGQGKRDWTPFSQMIIHCMNAEMIQI